MLTSSSYTYIYIGAGGKENEEKRRRVEKAKEKLMKISPTTLAQASRISGVSPSDISSILVKIGR